MSRVLVGVGGTGAKILESFVYMSIMGVPSYLRLNDIHLRMVDTDEPNGNKTRLKNLLSAYSGGLYDILNVFSDKEGQWKPASVSYSKLRGSGDVNQYNSEFYWDVGVNAIETLGEMIRDSKEGGNADILKMLYGVDDQGVSLIEGCHGKPRIGSLIYERFFDKDIASKGTDSFWRSLYAVALEGAMSTGENGGRIMFAGSIFGGTGASGIPTLARCFSNQYFNDKQKGSIGLTLMLPYYMYEDTPQCKAKSSDFALNSKVALRYYHDSGFIDELNAKKANPSLYLIGQKPDFMYDKDGERIGTNIAGAFQENPALPAEITAAFSSMHFFTQKFAEGEKVYVTETAGKLGELDTLPCVSATSTEGLLRRSHEYTVSAKQAVKRLKLFSTLWLVLKKHRPISSTRHIPPFGTCYTQIQDESASGWDSNLKSIDEFCVNAFEWLCQLEANGLDLGNVRGLYATISNLPDGDMLPSTQKIEGNSITSYYSVKLQDIEKSIKKKYGNNDYRNLLYAVMQVCSEEVKY
ncbi:MAG: tubulin-like doman-containing protein [Defluviitaleaceae bacterium]|nr:tubulin-like doman-containing protein [Defluviitaleaceae bacterium]